MPRHLIYHLAPLAGAEPMWRWNLRQLRLRLARFDGRKIVAVAQGRSCEPAERVRDCFGSVPGVEIRPVPNDPDLREAAAFPALLESVLPEPGVTFFAHSKGVTQDRSRRRAARRWAAAMYASLLDYPALVEDALRTHVFVGAYKRYGHFPNLGPPAACPWHYTGTFFWFANEAVRQRPWRGVPAHRFGVEAWPPLVARDEEASGLLPAKDRRSEFYNPGAWRTTYWPEFQSWRRQHADLRAP